MDATIANLRDSLGQSRHPAILSRDALSLSLRYRHSVPAHVVTALTSVATAIDRYNTLAGPRLHERAIRDSRGGEPVSMQEAGNRFARDGTMMLLSGETADILSTARDVIGKYLNLGLPPLPNPEPPPLQ